MCSLVISAPVTMSVGIKKGYQWLPVRTYWTFRHLLQSLFLALCQMLCQVNRQLLREFFAAPGRALFAREERLHLISDGRYAILNQLRFDNQIAIVTGAGGGLGRAYAHLLAERGARVVVNDYVSENAEKVAREIVDAGGEAIADAHNIADANSGEAIVRPVIERWGSVHIIVNNAGIGTGGNFPDIADEVYQKTLDVSFFGSLRITREAWPHMLKQNYGRIVNVLSETLFGGSGVPPYMSTKGALLGLTKSLAFEGRNNGIKANAVMPAAWTRMTEGIPESSPFVPIMKLWKPEQVAPTIVWLAHESFPLTGEIFLSEGGRVARVFMGVAPGIISREGTPEELVARSDELLSTEGFIIPVNATESVRDTVRKLTGKELPPDFVI